MALGREYLVSSKCGGVVRVFAHAFILNPFQCDIC